jgi:hypothetical protein
MEICNPGTLKGPFENLADGLFLHAGEFVEKSQNM